MGGWWIRSLFWTCVLGGSPTSSPSPLPPLHPSSLMIGNRETTSKQITISHHRAFFPWNTTTEKTSAQLGTTTQVQLLNWEEQPKFQLCLVFIKELIFFLGRNFNFSKTFFFVWLYAVFDFYKTIIIYQNWVFGFMRIGVINPKNHPDTWWWVGFGVVSNNCQHWFIKNYKVTI